MARYHAEDEWEDDPEAPDEADMDDDGDDAGTIGCPHCGREVYEWAEQCPHCRKYLSEEDAPRARKAWWIVIGAALALAAALTWMLR